MTRADRAVRTRWISASTKRWTKMSSNVRCRETWRTRLWVWRLQPFCVLVIVSHDTFNREFGFFFSFGYLYGSNGSKSLRWWCRGIVPEVRRQCRVRRPAYRGNAKTANYSSSSIAVRTILLTHLVAWVSWTVFFSSRNCHCQTSPRWQDPVSSSCLFPGCPVLVASSRSSRSEISCAWWSSATKGTSLCSTGNVVL